MRALAVLALVLFSLTLQSTLLAGFDPFTPNFGVPFAIYLALTREPREGAILSWFLGYLVDIFLGGSTTGLRSFSLTITFLSIRPMHDKVQLEGFGSLAVICFFAALFNSLLETVLRRLFVSQFSLSASYLGGLFLSSVATAIGGAIALRIARRLATGQGKKDEGLLSR